MESALVETYLWGLTGNDEERDSGSTGGITTDTSAIPSCFYQTSSGRWWACGPTLAKAGFVFRTSESGHKLKLVLDILEYSLIDKTFSTESLSEKVNFAT
jgi:hypothetical protein